MSSQNNNQAPIQIKRLERTRFEALAGHSRSPMAALFGQEVEWYADEAEILTGVLILDTNKEYAAVVMGRDEGGRYCAIDQESCFSLPEEARNWMEQSMKWHISTGEKEFPQGGPTRGLDLFTPVVPLVRQHPYFVQLSKEDAYSPAKSMIEELMRHYVDVDGNFVEQFQSAGFDARLWELYLNTCFIELEFSVERPDPSPDFLLSQFGSTIAVEAVIAGRKADNPPSYFNNMPATPTPEEIMRELENDMPIRFGSPLFTKLKKEYWKLPHVEGKPLILAIADFHGDQTMLWSSTALQNSLFGLKHQATHDEAGNLSITPRTIKEHRVGSKVIPSGFFSQPNTEHLSGVLFSASGTIAKFNRMGRQSGFDAPGLKMIRKGFRYNPDPNASTPLPFCYEVNESCREAWSEGLVMFHNPNALHPVSMDSFPNTTHLRLLPDGQVENRTPLFAPFSSVTTTIKLVK